MPSYITHGATTLTPTAVTNVTSTRQSGNLVHEIIGRAEPDITLRPASTRVGVLELAYVGPDSEDDSALAELTHATGAVFTLHSPDVPSLGFAYVLDGALERAQDTTRKAWTVRVPYREVTT
jgi:L-lactate permease